VEELFNEVVVSVGDKDDVVLCCMVFLLIGSWNVFVCVIVTLACTHARFYLFLAFFSFLQCVILLFPNFCPISSVSPVSIYLRACFGLYFVACTVSKL
jgi:hypothetical protein